MDKLCDCVSCDLFAAHGEKFGNKSVQLTTIQQQVQMDLCQNKQRFKASVCSYQSSSYFQSRTQTKISTSIKSNFVVEVQSKVQSRIGIKTTTNFQTTIQTTVQSKAESKRIVAVGQGTKAIQSSPARNFNSLPKKSMAVVPVQKTVPKTPMKVQPKALVKTQPKINKSASKFSPKLLGAVIKEEKTSDLDLKPTSATSIPKDDTDRNENKLKSVSTDPVEAVKTIKKEIDVPMPTCVKIEKIERISPIKIEPSSDNEEQDAPETPIEDKIAQSNDDDTETTSPQLNWTEEVLSLLNTGSEEELSKTLATIGPKTAIRITRGRKAHGKLGQIDDLQKRLGWSDKVHQKFLSKNFL